MHGSDELEAEDRMTLRETSVSKLRRLLARETRIHALSRDVAALRVEVETLRSQNARMKTAMRRCLTCEFRLRVVGGDQGSTLDGSPT